MDPLIAEIDRTKGILASCKVFIDGDAARIQAGIDAALAGGATAAQLATLQSHVDDMKAKSDEVAAALAANP